MAPYPSYFVAKLLKKASKKRQLDTELLTGYTGITVILLSFTDPDMVMLLPFKPETYELVESSPFPTKDALGVTAWKGVEDIVELIIQVAYLSAFGADTFVILNLLGTVIMVRGLRGKLINKSHAVASPLTTMPYPT